MRRAPQGHRREPFLRDFLGEQKVPRRRQNARREKKPGPQAQREQHSKGEEKCFQKRPGPQAQKRTTPGGQKSAGRRPKENNARRAKTCRAAWPIKTFSVGNQQPARRTTNLTIYEK